MQPELFGPELPESGPKRDGLLDNELRQLRLKFKRGEITWQQYMNEHKRAVGESLDRMERVWAPIMAAGQKIEQKGS